MNIGGIHYQSSFSSMESLFTAVQHAAFAQGFSVRRARTSRERKAGVLYAPDSPFCRIEIWCKCAGRSTATVRKSHKIKTNCPFKAIGTIHKQLGDRWLLRVVNGTHNHAPNPDLVDDKKFRQWFRMRLGGAYELEALVGIARMASVPEMNQMLAPPPPPNLHPPHPPQPQPPTQSGEQQEGPQQGQQQQQQQPQPPPQQLPLPPPPPRRALPNEARNAATQPQPPPPLAAIRTGDSRLEPMEVEPDSDEEDDDSSDYEDAPERAARGGGGDDDDDSDDDSD